MVRVDAVIVMMVVVNVVVEMIVEMIVSVVVILFEVDAKTLLALTGW